MTMGMQRAKTASASVMRQTGIVFAFIYDAFLVRFVQDISIHAHFTCLCIQGAKKCPVFFFSSLRSNMF